jgi:hypothetical protein
VTRPMIWILRCLALGHLDWGVVLLLVAGGSALSAFRILPYIMNLKVHAIDKGNNPMAVSKLGQRRQW